MKCVWLLVLAAVVRVPLASVDAECKTPWQDCGSTDLKINNVIVKGCCAVPCDVVLGGTTEFSFTFTPDKTFKGLNQTVCGELGPLCEKFPNEHFENMCNCEGCTLSKPCPFEANTMYNITVDVPLPDTFPANLKAVAKWQIYDSTPGATKPIGCFEVPIMTVKK